MDEYPFIDQKYAFAVCRIEPENNTHLLLEAFAEKPPMPLVIVGNWRFNEYGRKLFQEYSTRDSFYLLPAIYDPPKLNHIRSKCYFYLHGHSCGGTNPSLVEAMYLGLPVIAYDVNFNRETTENKALYFDSAAALRKLCTETPETERVDVSRAMKEIADRRYTWQRIAENYSKLF